MSAREPLQSPDWYRVARMRPRLRSGVRVTRQPVRGADWFVLSDPVSGRHHRINAPAYRLIAGCDGRSTLDQLWSSLVAGEGDAAPSQGEAIRVVAQCFGAGLLVGDIAPDARAIVRAQAGLRKRRWSAAVNPLSFRVPLWDPDAFLTAQAERLGHLFRPVVLAPAFAMVLIGVLLLLLNASAVADEAHRALGEGRTLLLLWLTYPVMKALHELAHAAAVKVRGGAVHEVGIAVLMLMPVPFVDASASTAFARKAHRIEVAAAGIFVEMLLASIALVLWLLLEPGLARDLAFAVVAAGLLSTVLVNGNPLLRFDGYFVLTEAAELPNLATRSLQYWLHLARRHLFGMAGDRFGTLGRGERGWLLAYAPLSWLYRVALVASLVLLVAQWSATAGLAMLALGAWWVFGKPLLRALRFVLFSPMLRRRRTRAWTLTGAAVAGLLATTFALPLPDISRAPGVVWLPDDAQLRSATDGVLQRYEVSDGQRVEAGTAVATLENEALRVELALAQAALVARRVEQRRLQDTDPARAAWMDEEVAALQARSDELQARVDALVVRAGVAGRVVLEPRRVLPGQFLAQGELVAQVLPPGPLTVRALVGNNDIVLVRERVAGARVQLASDGATSHAAVLGAAVPEAGTALPTAALGEPAGGPVAVDPADPQGRTAREPRFTVDLRVDGLQARHVGERVMVTFDHGSANAAELLLRQVRRAFLRWFPQ